ncbi:hypothetical protein MKW98_019101 [Papaver atlanticum]|uniref:Peptidase A1 domain-containing protein n=1 Tax=Papaver atlanticum TaxID=357466 RepID=A0AAD4TL19_9MAGN|nr:hypothetical protein MKW98_019101 [Papaver atlanticum]
MGIRFMIFFFVKVVLSILLVNGEGGGLFKVKHKFGSEANRSLTDLVSHDHNRHGRLLSAAIDVPLGGDGKTTGTGLYYTKLGIGTPPTDYFLLVDTGSDVLWVNCINCNPRANQTQIDGLKLKLYDPQRSSTSTKVSCGDAFCSHMNNGPGCSSDGGSCGYHLEYADGSESAGYVVTDTILFDQVAGNHQTTFASSPITFGCGVQQSGNLVLPKGALDGLVGFGAATTSILSQLASSGKVKKKFAHCLDGKRGGGIFVMGGIVEPKLKTTPLVAHQTHYNVIMESIQVGDAVLNVSELLFGAADKKGAIIDSGTTLAYFPPAIFNPLRQLIIASQPNLSIQFGEDFFECFEFNKSIDDSFPIVTFGFENSLQLNVFPHDYLILNKDQSLCFGWQESMKSDEIILGDLVLTNKLVLYDLENQVLGLAEYNCSSPIGLDLSSSPARYNIRRVIKLLLLLSFMLYVQ